MSDLEITDIPSIDLELTPQEEIDIVFEDIKVVEKIEYVSKEVMPTPSEDYVGKVFLYVGETNEKFVKGDLYKGVKWTNTTISPATTSYYWVDLNSTLYIMPETAHGYEGRIVRYIGETNEKYTYGKFYEWYETDIVGGYHGDFRESNIYATSDEINEGYSNVIMLGIDGIIEANRVIFTVQDADSFMPYRTNQREFLVTGNLPIVGQLDDTLPVAITFGDTTYNVYSFLKGGDTPLTVGDLKSVMSYNIDTGYYLYSRMIFLETSDIVGFAIMPATITARQLDAIVDDTDTIVKMTDSTGTKLSLHLSANIVNKLSKTLVVPMSAPSTTELVAVDSNGNQTMIEIGDNLSLENGKLNATGEGGGSGGGLSIADLPKFVNKIYINMANATALNGLMSLPCVESSNFIVTFPDGTSQEYIQPTTLIEHQFADVNQEGWVYVYGDWKGISFGSSGYTNERKIITQLIYDNNITSMPTYALYSSSNLVRLGLPESLTTMNDHCIFNCDALKKIIIPDNVTKMGNQIISSCNALLKIKLPINATKTTKVNNSLIYEFDIPHTVTEIETGTFQACSNLKSITIPDKVVKIGPTAFNGCSNLKTVSVLPITPPTFTNQSDFQYVDQFFMPAQSLQQYKNATNWVLFADKIYPKGGTYSETITIPSTAWDSATNTATVEAVGATNEARNVITWFTSSGGSQVENTYGLKCTEQGTMQLTFSCETIPTEDVEVSVSYMLTNYA